MLGVSATGALIPLAFFASVVYVVLQMEKRLAAGDERFLRSFLFLFFRFRTGAHTYIAIFLFRNLIIAVVPALGSTMFQIMILQVIMIPLLVVTVYFMPWNAFLANLIDGSSTMLLSLIVTLFAFYCEDVDAEIVAQLCTAICCIAFIIIFCAIAWGMLAQILRMEKPMQFFLCHHKDGAGNFTRLLKMSLDTKSKKEIGVDSDYIDPSALFATVASDVDMLVTVCSRQIVSQLFCVGEMTTAKLNKVPVCNVLLPDFAYPSEDFVNKYDIEMPRVTHLARYGLNLETVKASLPNPGQESVKLPSHITSGTIQSLVGMLTREHAAVSLQDDKGTIDPSGSSSFFIVADMGALECACAALVLQLLLARAVQGKAAEVPQLLPLGAALPSSAEKVCLVLSNGVFASPHVATALRRAADANAAVLPVVAEPSFRFPTKGSLQQLAEGAPGAPGECTGAELARLVARTCEGAVVEASPQAPEADLLVRAQAVLAWLSEARLLAVEPRPDAWVQLGDQPGPGGPDEGPEDGQAGAEQDGAGAEASPHVAV
ncbi:unnamed protein product [Prorocentrum cordatum]|uniref:Uncharacterized protein n=1 Tax=Prorocentrum cordatum TaxID=2364126 RepID=A0ABN9RPL7_9DINO|nr:unnamed protein product [Polarella glacialis]